MVKVWRDYRTDMGRAYPMFALSVAQVNDKTTNVNPLDLLPPTILSELIEVKYPCGVTMLTPRMLVLWASDGAQFSITYPRPFSQNLSDYLTLNTQVAAFEFVGERIKHGRLRKMLDNV